MNQPSFTGISVDEQIYTATAAIPDLLLPAPNHGARPLSYTLVPVPEGLSFDRETRTLSGTPTLPTAITELELTATGNNGASDRLRFRVTVAKPPRFVSEVEDMLIRAKRHTVPMILPHAEDGHGSFTYNLQERRDGRLRNLPEYTLFDPASRELKIYSKVRVYTLVYTATDTNGAVATQDFIVTATKPQLPPALGYTFDRGVPITPVVLPAATGGIGAVTYSFSGPALGFKFDPDTRIMSGTPRIASADLPDTYFLYYYSAQDEAGGGGTTQLQIRVRENSVFPPYIPMFFDPPLSDDLLITRGIAFERVFPAPMGGTGANPLFNYSTHFESLPQGIQFERYTRRLHGTAAQVTSGGGYPFRYTVADVGSVREQIVAHLKIKVVEQPSFAEPLRLSLRQNERLPDAPAEQIKLPAAIDGAPPLVYTLEGGMPPGLAFDAATRALSGTPTEDGASTLIYTATDANGAVASGDFVFTVVDTVRPEVTGLAIISTPSRDTAPYETKTQDTYLLGERIRMRLDFSEPVLVAADVSPKPILHLNLEIGSTDIPIQFHFPADSNAPVMALEGSYLVQEGDLDEDGISSSQLFLAGVPAEITDAAGNELDLHIPGLPTNPAHKVDGVVPKVSLVLVRRSPANDTYRLGEEIKVLIAFDSLFPLFLGQLSLQLTLDSGVVTARNSGTHQGIGSHGRGFDFSYVVQAGDGDENGISLGADALMLVAGEIITDDSGNPVNLSLAEFAFNDDPRYKVDTAAPRVTAMSVISTPRLAGHYSAGERITARVDFNEPVTVADDTTPILQMSLGDDAPRLVAMEYEEVQAGADSMLFGYTVQAGDEDNNGISIGADALEVTGGSLTDVVGNPAANLDLTAFAFENDSQHKVDGVGPQVTNVSITSRPEQFGYYAAGERITARLDFNESVTVAGGTTPVLSMSLGDATPRLVAMEYETAQAGDDFLLFGYTVQAGDEDHNGIGIAADALEVTGGSLTDTLGNPAADLGLTAFAIENDPQHKVDGVVPDITAPADMTLEATAVMTPLTADENYGTATSTDTTATISSNAPDVFPLGATTITWTATDPATNEMIATQVVTIVDTTPPDIALLGDNPQTVEFGTTYTELNATATDEVDDDDELTRRIVIDVSGVDTNQVGNHLVTYDVSDTNNNAATTVTRMVTVTDTAAPDIIAPADITFEATGIMTPLDRSDYGIATSGDDNADITDDAPDAFPLGPTTITWTATDKSTNEMMDTQVVTVVDTTKPDITAPGNIIKEATGPTTPVTVGLATAMDLVTASVIITRTPEGNEFAVGTHTITWKADDDNGNIITAEQTVTITDTTAPVIALLGDNPQTVEFGSVYTDPGATATDAVDDNDELTTQIAAISTVDTGTVGDYTITYTVSDTATNAATPVIRMVTVTDTAAPTITAPADITLEATDTLTPLGRTHYGTATSGDDTADITDDAPDAFPLGATTITWTATDKSNNEDRATQVVTVVDTTKPVIALLGDNPQTVEFGTTYTELNATATDEVDDDIKLTARIVADASTVDVDLLGTYPVTYDVTDAEGNAADRVTRMVMVTDTVIPDITAPLAMTFEATDTLTPLSRSDYGTATSGDDTADITDDAPDAFPLGDTTITWTATDPATNEMMATQVVTIVDTTPPVIALLGDNPQTVEFGSTYTDPGATATDAVDDNDELTIQIAAASTVDTGTVGDYTVTYTVSDTATNAATPVIRMVTVTDTAAPDIIAPADMTFEATDTLTPLDRTHYGTATSTDREAMITDDAPLAFSVGVHTITWTATDTNTLFSTAAQTITITDTTAPDITAPENIIKEATGPTTPVTVGQATATDLVTDPVIITRSPEGNEFAVGTHTITWKADDGNGNIITAEQTITITDTTPPVIVLLGDNPQTVEFGSIYNDPGATATDAVDDNDELTIRIAAVSTVNTGTVGDYTVTYTVSDKATNAATPVIRMVTVEDTAAPDITAPAAITFEATDTLTPLGRTHYGTATSTDREAMITDDAPLAFSVGVHTITWTATDTNTLFSTAAQTITITDNTKPDITAPENIIKEATGPTTPVTVGLATATDLVTDPVIITRTPEGNEFAVGTHTITWKADDGNGNIITAAQTITITDTTKPVIVLLGDNPQTVEFGTAYTELNATATDEVDDDIKLTARIVADANAVDTGTVGDYTVTYTVSDKATNAATPEIRTVIVTDTAAPDITAPNTYTTEATATLTPLDRSDYGIATSGDDTADITDDAPDAFPLGATTITWRATDTNTLFSTATQTITITDTTKPVIALLGTNPQTVEFGSVYTDPGATATDAVDDNDELTIRIAAVSTVDTGTVGDYTITYTVSDKATNAATPVLRMVIVTDTAAPDITAPNTYTTEATDTLTPLDRSDYGIATSGDDTADITDDAPDAFPLGPTTITWTATDKSTNEMMDTQVVTVVDTTKPDIAAPGNIIKEATAPTTPVTVGQATATDLVTDPVIITRTPEGNEFAVGTHTITWKADDGNGNIITAAQTVTITDTTPPVIVLLGDNPQTVEFGSIYNDPGATATDAVDDNDELTIRIAAVSTVNTGTVGDYTVTYTVSDKATNAATPVLRMVMVTDTAAPDIIAPADITFEATDTLTPLGRTHYGIATSSDDTADITDDAPDAFPLGATTITWTATDPAGNEMMDTQVVTVVDTTKPVIALNGLPEVRVEFGGSYTELQATATDAVDDDIQLTDKIVIAGTVDTNLAGIYHITYDVTDAAGNDAITVTRTVTLGAAQIVIDKVPPTIIAPSDVVVEATSPRTTVRVGQATATDNMDPMPAITRTPTGNEFVVGKHTITWTATDASDNSNSVEQTITITDTTKPSIALLGDNPQTVEFGSIYNDPGATATDAVDDNDELTIRIAAASTVNTGTVGDYTVTYTVSDKATNAATPVTRMVTVTDTEAPDISPPADITFEATDTLTPLGRTHYGTATSGDDTADITDDAPDAFPLGDTPITWRATDTNALFSTAAQTITITDTTAPDIAAPRNITKEATGPTTPVTVGLAIATDLVTDPVIITRTPEGDEEDLVVGSASVGDIQMGNEFAVGTHKIIWTADDGNGNIITAEQTITITDTTKPRIVLLGDNPQTVEFGSTYTDPDATATDLVDDDIKLTEKIHAVSTVDTGTVGDYTVTYDVTDAEGNAADRVTRMVMVTDTVIPDITAPLAITFEATDTLTPLSRSDYGTATSTDGNADITDDAPDAFPLGATTITWTATDKSTNEMIARQVVTVEDTTAPMITMNGASPQTVKPGSTYSDPGATATDAVDDNDELTTQIAAVSTVDTGTVGQYTITYDVTDAEDNPADTVTRMVMVTNTPLDTTAPVITLLGDNPMTIEVDEDYVEPGATAFDRMDGDRTDQIAIDATEVDTNTVGTYTVTYTVADLQDNQAQASRSVQVLASPDLADLNRVILSEVARTMADQNVSVVARRVEQAGQNAAHATSVGGQSSLANILAAQGRALADDQFNLKQLLAEAEFALPLSADAAPATSVPTFWGTGDYRQIDSTDQLDWDGDFLSLHLGADAHMDDMVGGVALSWSRAELDYRNYHTPQTATHAGRNNASGEYEVDMTSVHPYMGWTSGQMDFWATLGYSDGKLKITDQGDDGKDMRRSSSDLDLRTVAVGGSGPLLNDGATNLRVKTEALHSELIVAGDAQIAALSLTVSRLRLTLEATRNWALYNGAQLDLSWQGGLRYDGGTGNTGAGNEIGGGLRYVDAARGLTLEGKARGLVTDKGDTQEWGISGLIKFQGSAHGHGLSFSLTPEYGEADPDMQEFWQRDLREDDDDAEVAEYAARWDIRLGYGMSGPGGHGLLTPYSEITLSNNGNTYRLGLAWKLDSLFDVKLVTEHRHSIDESEQRVILQGTITF